ncbi:sugar phosphate isomerase/epimerase family protein [Mycobacterium sp. AZCC_0083]|uniref:sugar phosphate isomerase/epimerase family protein n=1 Tax=Mycobacterium sp. AZCC_0083 TaxID=2735882 RepID=UPI0017EB4E31|nr:sugar phosphate isomerase/epimerase family protein [Mycobacterium sp. AZCC_0083]MBB5164097.1 sugar phosphate isomerase/epimerase [Mycobacterium sp. AZCC_0083]
MTEPSLVATAWSSAGAVSPMDSPAVSPVPIAKRIGAIADAGFCGFGLVADDLRVIRDDIGFEALRDLISAAGLVHVEIELLERWWIPRGQPGNTYDVRGLLFEAADVLGPSFIKIGSENGPPVSDPLALAEPLRKLAEQAAAHGTRVAIETMPFSAIATVPMGAEIVAAAGHPAAGLLVDAWHVFRADTSLEELRAALWPEVIFGVELDDAASEIVGTLFEDTVDRRVLCGEGCFDLTGLVATLRDLGFDGPWGVEVLSTSYRALPVGHALKLAAGSALTVL